ncbi:MAG TPA: Gldg family protein [Acidimicrobiales bacterium]|nr:Gldg family protein [Acidimicrobiales bacterium]
MTARLARTTVLLAVVVAVGAVLSSRHQVHDLTAERSLTLTGHTRAVLGDLADDVDITAFLRRGEPGRVEAAALLDRYGKESRRVDWEVVDPDEAPGEVARLGVDPAAGGVVLRAGEEVELALAVTEQDLTAALARLARGRDAEICVTTGHGEPTLDRATALLERDGYRIRLLDLLADAEVPGTCTGAILAGAATPLGDAAGALASWTADDGKLLVLTDPRAEVDLTEILDPYGLGLQGGAVFEGDPAAVVSGDVTAPIVRTYSSGHPIVRRLAPTYFPGVQGVSVDDRAEQRVAGLTVSRLADTSASSYLETAPGEASFDPAKDVPGPVTVAAAADRTRNDGSRILRTRVVVVGDVDFATDAFLTEAANADLLLRAVGWLVLEDDLISLSANLPADRPLRLTDARITYARLLTAGVVPAVFLLVGATGWAIRRRR